MSGAQDRAREDRRAEQAAAAGLVVCPGSEEPRTEDGRCDVCGIRVKAQRDRLGRAILAVRHYARPRPGPQDRA